MRILVTGATGQLGSLVMERLLAAVLGREVPVQHVDDAEYASGLRQAGLPDPVVDMIVAMNRAIRAGALDVRSDDLVRLLGRPPVPLAEALRAVAAGR